GVVAAFGRVLGGILVGIPPGALLGATYLGGEGGPLAGGVCGALVGGCLGSIGRPFSFWPVGQKGHRSIPEEQCPESSCVPFVLPVRVLTGSALELLRCGILVGTSSL